MKLKSALATEMSGSLGGMVASHNRGGLYLRARVIPVNPNTSLQQVIRGFVAQLSSLWLNTLTFLQREAWDEYALQVPLPDRLGEPRNVGGLAMYVRSNVPRLQNDLTRVDDAPTIFNLGDYTPPSISSLSEATQSVFVVFQEEDPWVSEDGAAMLFYASASTNLSINYYKGPYRLFDTILGNNTLPPTSPDTLTGMRPFVFGQKMFFRLNVTRVDGRLGTQQFYGINTVNGPATARPASAKRKANKRSAKKT